MSRFVVQTLLINDRWDNAWHDDEEVPTTFATREEAQAELDEFIECARHAYNMGYLSTCYEREDYRIVEVDE